jgi:3-oxoacyl-(acyl-carrier-protein) synthase
MLMVMEADPVPRQEARCGLSGMATALPSGMNLGTAGAFLVLESLDHAQAAAPISMPGSTPCWATADPATGDRLEQRLARLADETGATARQDTVVFSGATGFPGPERTRA